MLCSLEKNVLLAIDVGNSRFKYGLFIESFDSKTNHLPLCSQKITMRIDEPLLWDDLLANVPQEKWASIRSVIAGANPVGIQRICDHWQKEIPAAQIVSQSKSLPITNGTKEPESVGIDRLLNGVAVNHIRPPETPAIIVDSGTATTVDLISSEGTFEGGAILPGFELSAFSLHHYTTLLPLLSMKELTSQQTFPYGQNTSAALQSGILWGQVGAVKELIFQIQSTLSHQAAIYLTGGGATLIAPHLPSAQHIPDLSLQGLALSDKGQ